MKKINKKVSGIFLFLHLNFFLFAQSEYSALSKLLTGFLEEDLQLKKYVLEAKTSELDNSSTKIQTGINFSLSTGNVSVKLSDDSNSISVSPEVNLNIPSFANSKIELKLPLEIEKSETYVKNGNLSYSFDIFSSSTKERQIELLESERALILSKRNVKKRALSAEKEFYEILQKLFNYAVTIYEKKSDYYDDSLALKVLQTQGYSTTSAKYRQAYLKVQSDEREIKEKIRILVRETANFAFKCGVEFNSESTFEEVLAFLPDKIPLSKSENILDYKKEKYSKIESELYNQKLASLKREAKKDLTLSATALYKFNSDTSNSDDAGGNFLINYKGIDFSSGMFFPTNNSIFKNSSSASASSSPYFQFSFGFDPIQWKLDKIEKEQDKIDEESEKVSLKIAEEDYDSTVLSKISLLNDIEWSRKANEEELSLYTQLEKDMKIWLSEGIVTESDYIDSLNNKRKSEINVILNKIENAIFNGEIKILFVE